MLALVVLGIGCGNGGEQPAISPTTQTEATTTATSARSVVGFASVSIRGKAQEMLDRVEIVPRHPVVAAGETMVFSALAYDESGKTLPSGPLEIRWRTTDPRVGTVTHGGIFRAGTDRGVFDKAIEVTVIQGVGGQTVAARKLASVSIIRPVSENDINRVQVLPPAIQAEPGTTVEFTPLALDRSGTPVPGVTYTWEMLDPRAGSIDRRGHLVVGEAEASYPHAIRVTARKENDPSRGVSSVVSVTIQRLPGVQQPSKVSLYPQGTSIRPGETIEFRAIVLDPVGNLVTDVQTTWLLNDPQAGVLSDNGTFKAGDTPGTYRDAVEVTVTPVDEASPGALKAKATVTILSPEPEPDRLRSLIVTPESIRLRPGESREITASVLNDYGRRVMSAQLDWSGNSDVVEVTREGLVTAKDNPGTYVEAVTVTATTGEGEDRVTKTSSATVTILGPLDRVEIVPSEVTVGPGEAAQFTFIAYDTNGARLFDVQSRWEAVDPSAGTIDSLGFFLAGATAGEYPDAIKLTVSPREG